MKWIRSKEIFLVIIILLALARLLNLSADPSIILNSGQVGDEGYWLYNARHLTLFGKLAPDDFYHDLAAAPLFSFFSYLSFSIFGVGFWQGRLLSAIAGVFTLFITYLIAKRISRKVALLSTFLVAFNTIFLMQNRLATAESLSIMFAIAGFYFFLSKGASSEIKSGLFFALSLLSKITSFLYLPSIGLILMFEIMDKKPSSKRLVKFILTFISASLVAFLTLLIFWGEQIRIVYSTFGPWYVPLNIPSIWKNISAFFVHPFWGSPFLFSILILALINLVNYFLNKKNRSYDRRFLILWLLGILFFGPLISILSNARLLGLIVPICILGSQTVIDTRVSGVNFKRLKLDFTTRFNLPMLSATIMSFPIAIIGAKLTLAIFKRISGNEMIVYSLPYMSLVIALALSLLVIRDKKLYTRLLKFNVRLIVFLPLVSFIPLFWDYLIFFEWASPIPSLWILLITAFIFSIFYLLTLKRINPKKIALPLLIIYVVFNIVGLATVFAKPSYKMRNASASLGKTVGDSSLIGFYGQQLALENESKPIYWSPRLRYAEKFNSDWQNFEPKFLLEPHFFDSIPGSIDSWPTRENLNTQAEEILKLDLTRQFLKAERKFEIGVYELNY